MPCSHSSVYVNSQIVFVSSSNSPFTSAEYFASYHRFSSCSVSWSILYIIYYNPFHTGIIVGGGDNCYIGVGSTDRVVLDSERLVEGRETEGAMFWHKYQICR